MRLLGEFSGVGFLPCLGSYGLLLNAAADNGSRVVALDHLLDRAQFLGIVGVLGISLALEVAAQEQGESGQHQDEELRRAAHFSANPCEVAARSNVLRAGKATATTK